MPAQLVTPLLHDCVDIIGDVHGEIEALRALLARLGCDVARLRCERPLVFVGDLVDRGPDSVAVVALVQELVSAGMAQVVLGNHELNIVLGEHKEGNGWFLPEPGRPDGFHHEGKLVPFDSRSATVAERAEIGAFFRSCPVALESDALRVVHAAWIPGAIAAARAAPSLDAFLALEDAAPPAPPADAPTLSALRDANAPVPFHAALAASQLVEQNGRPAKILTSGLERIIAPHTAPRFFGGKWRMLERHPWWEHDDDPRAVVFGHYWRRRTALHSWGGKPELTMGAGPRDWFGRHEQAFCVDFSVGYRFKARAGAGGALSDYALAALRWPERTLVFDDDPAA